VTVGDSAATTFKYGVIDVRDFRRDLLRWCTLYTAGRLHKPVVTLLDDRGGLGGLVARNLESAVHASLLQLPEKFAEKDLYATIAGLSYRGDFRMVVGEDKHKVANIVEPQIERFRSLYAPAFRSMSDRLLFVGSFAEQDSSVDGKLYHLQRLPANLKNIVLSNRRDGDARSPLRALAERSDVDKIVRDGVRRIVLYSSLTQSIKGIPTAGLLKSVVYSYNKLNKMVKSMFL